METLLIEVPIPSMGATVSELTIIDIRVSSGAKITKGEKIAELESDKSVFEFEAPCDGVIQQIIGRAGDILSSGAPFLRIQTTDQSLKHLAVKELVGLAAGNHRNGHEKPPAIARSAEVKPVLPNRLEAARPLAGSSGVSTNGIQWTPRALKLATDAGMDPKAILDIVPTGPGSRVSGDDVAKYLEMRSSRTNTADSSSAPVEAEDAFLPYTQETVCVAGIGYAVPNNVRGNKEILKAFPDMTEDEVIKLTGIRERRYADPDESATSLAATAVQHALAMAGISPAEIDGVIMATLIPDQPVPSMASALAKHLGIKTALAFDLNAACAGWLYALEVGRAFIRSGTAHKLIVVTAELLSRITNPKDHATAFLFGDGAGAAILTDAPGGHRLNLMKLLGDSEYFSAIQRTGGGALKPLPSPGGHDLEHFYLQMDGAVVFKHAVRAFADLIENTLARHRLKPNEIAWVVPHQANERILRAVSKRVGISYERFVMTIGKYGNTSAASVSMAFGWAAEEGIFHPGDKIIFCSVGAGLTFAGGLLVW